MRRKLLLYSALLLLTQCSQCKNDDPTPADPAGPQVLTGIRYDRGFDGFGRWVGGC